MDEQTLKYMGERVDRAREINKKITELRNFIKYSEGKDEVVLESNGRGRVDISSRRFERLSAKAKAAVLNEVEEEIKLLEQELAEI
ncbi:hypothetical protein [Paenibacillus brevis]|uniref:Uncharacterized protein n=1 Tax=Paenibacillus brevis TaxID=2841508 RepID=A0ABS6FRM2_9BACL|nr:hypothetical protein [Paenibacillus brevis]MBU5672678.1 hypothetical protein [Paenibacillus brevis]